MLSIEWLPFAGGIVGLIVGLTGVGGGALMAPILLLGLELDLATVVATVFLFATTTKLAVTRVHKKIGLSTRLLWAKPVRTRTGFKIFKPSLDPRRLLWRIYS